MSDRILDFIYAGDQANQIEQLFVGYFATPCAAAAHFSGVVLRTSVETEEIVAPFLRFLAADQGKQSSGLNYVRHFKLTLELQTRRTEGKLLYQKRVGSLDNWLTTLSPAGALRRPSLQDFVAELNALTSQIHVHALSVDASQPVSVDGDLWTWRRTLDVLAEWNFTIPAP
jgi:hypothetical protein